jgi:hypothetical protein
MTKMEESSVPANGAEGSQAGPVHSRRRLLRVGLGAAPVAIAFVSPPVLACVGHTTSAHGSLNASRAPRQVTHGSTCRTSQGWYDLQTWPANFTCQKTTPITNVLTGCPLVGGNNQPRSCQWVLSTSNTDELSKRCLTAYLNACNGALSSSGLSPAECKKMYSDCRSSGYKVGTALWGPTQVCNYLAATHQG